MTDEEIKAFIEQTARAVVAETKRQMILNDADKMADRDVSDMLKNYFRSHKSKKNKKLEKALQEVSHDPYYQIIILYYQNGETMERIADLLYCDIGTVSRNKKRLCRMIYKKII